MASLNLIYRLFLLLTSLAFFMANVTANSNVDIKASSRVEPYRSLALDGHPLDEEEDDERYYTGYKPYLTPYIRSLLAQENACIKYGLPQDYCQPKEQRVPTWLELAQPFRSWYNIRNNFKAPKTSRGFIKNQDENDYRIMMRLLKNFNRPIPSRETLDFDCNKNIFQNNARRHTCTKLDQILGKCVIDDDFIIPYFLKHERRNSRFSPDALEIFDLQCRLNPDQCFSSTRLSRNTCIFNPELCDIYDLPEEASELSYSEELASRLSPYCAKYPEHCHIWP